MSYSCWTLTDTARDLLMAQVKPVFPDVVAHHVTCEFGSAILPPDAVIRAKAVVVDSAGVQAIIVSVKVGDEPATMKRPDGNFYHITWSIDREKGKKPFHSVEMLNRLYATTGVQLPRSIALEVMPEVIE